MTGHDQTVYPSIHGHIENNVYIMWYDIGSMCALALFMTYNDV